MARRRIVIVVEAVVPEQFLAGSNVAQGEDPDPALDFVDFAIGVAGMVQVSGHAFSVDDGLAIVQSIQISALDTFVATVRLFG